MCNHATKQTATIFYIKISDFNMFAISKNYSQIPLKGLNILTQLDIFRSRLKDVVRFDKSS